MLVEREIRDFQMLLDTEDPGLSAELLEQGTREGDSPDVLSSIVQPSWTCIDIGANLGFFALNEAAKGASVHAIEPVPQNVDILWQAAVLNGFKTRMSIYQLALGNRIGTSRFYKTAASNWGCIADARATSLIGEEIEVLEMPLDTFVKAERISRVDLLRFDIEGYEIELVEGAQETLAAMHGWIMCELHPRSFDDPMTLAPTIDNLLEHGFIPRVIVPDDGHAIDSFPLEWFAEWFCQIYKGEAPNVFLEKP